MNNSIKNIATISELSIMGTVDDQTRLILINNASTAYVQLRGADSIYERLQHAVKLATNKHWDKFYQVVQWSIKDLEQLMVEDCPGQAVRG